MMQAAKPFSVPFLRTFHYRGKYILCALYLAFISFPLIYSWADSSVYSDRASGFFPFASLAAQQEKPDENLPDPGIIAGDRDQGDIGLQVNGYVWAPLFHIDPNPGGETIRKTNLSPGGGVDLAVAYYLGPRLGIGGTFNLGLTSPASQSNLQNYFLALSLGPRISYDINIYTNRFTSHPLFTFPLGFSLAFSVVKFGDITNLIPSLKFDAGVYINPFKQPEWSFGISLHYWLANEVTKKRFSRIGNYLLIGIGFNFHTRN